MSTPARRALCGAIVLDVDGTMVAAPSDRIADRLAEALLTVHARGWAIVVATSRSPRSIEKLGFPDGIQDLPMVIANGAALLELRTGNLSRHRLIEPRSLRLVLDVLDGADFDSVVCTIAREAEPVAAQDTWKVQGRDNVERDAWALKVVARARGRTAGSTIGMLAHQFGSSLSLSHTRGEIVEITAAGATKLDAVQALLGRHELDASRTVAFGDSMNDYEVLRWANRSFAVAPLEHGLEGAVNGVLPRAGGDSLASAIEREVEQMGDRCTDK